MPGVSESHREGEAGKQGRRRDQQRANPPGADRVLGASRGQQKGDEQTPDTVADAGEFHGEQR